MKKANKNITKDTDKTTKEKNDHSKDAGDDDSITRNMPDEIRVRIQEKRKRNKKMLNDLTQQIKHFDNTKQLKRNKTKEKESETNTKKANNKTKTDECTHKEDGTEVYIVEGILNHMRKRNNKWLLIKWKGYDVPTWEPEETMRMTINDDVDAFWKKMQQIKDKDKVNKANPICCSFEHSNPLNFYQTSNAWEVEKKNCHGKNCSIDFEVDKCSEKNIAWVCEGRKRSVCNVVYCNKCFFNDKNVVHAKRKRR